jgi:hypothetical protein
MTGFTRIGKAWGLLPGHQTIPTFLKSARILQSASVFYGQVVDRSSFVVFSILRSLPREFCDSRARNRIAPIRGDLAERIEHKRAIAKPRMRHPHSGLVNHVLPVPNQVKIERAGRPFAGALASARGLDGSFTPVGIASRYHYDFDWPAPVRALAAFLLPFERRPGEEHDLFLPGKPHSFARSSLDLRCFDSVPGRAGIDCFATDGRRTHLWRVDVREGRLDPIGWTSSTLWAHQPAVGSRWVVSSGRCRWGIIDMADRSIALLADDDRRCPYDVAIADSRLATLTRADTGEIELRVYAISSAEGALSSIEE